MNPVELEVALSALQGVRDGVPGTLVSPWHARVILAVIARQEIARQELEEAIRVNDEKSSPRTEEAQVNALELDTLESENAKLRERVQKAEDVLVRISDAESRWSTCDQSVRLAQVGLFAVMEARAALGR